MAVKTRKRGRYGKGETLEMEAGSVKRINIDHRWDSPTSLSKTSFCMTWSLLVDMDTHRSAVPERASCKLMRSIDIVESTWAHIEVDFIAIRLNCLLTLGRVFWSCRLYTPNSIVQKDKMRARIASGREEMETFVEDGSGRSSSS